MRMHLIIAILALVPAPLSADDESLVIQHGQNNFQSTTQAGGNFAATVQLGADNAAVTEQTGKNNISAIVQVGEDHSQNHSMNGDHQAIGSLQVSTELPPTSSSMSAASVTLNFEAN